ncbi:reverse transcriptase domain-containing protein [Tanacetum coccineum]
MDIFAWQPSDMIGVPRSVVEHRLNIREGYLPVRQKKRGQAPKRAKAIQAEVHKLIDAVIMKEVYYYDWLSNPIMVKKHDGSWRMCVDFTDLNKACPQDCYPLPEIDWKVESLCGYPFKCFLDAYIAEKSLPLFKTLKKCIKKSDFHWTSEAEQAFKQLKQHLSKLPLLVALKPKEELIVYLSASHGAISAVLITERGMIQTPFYFISRALQGPEINYTPMEKLVLELVFVAKRLRRYFQAHPIAVITNQPIKKIIPRPDVAGRLQKWSVMLGEHNITYRPRTSIKGQILADFLVEKPDEAPPDTPEGTEFTYALRFQFTASNNEAEYEALIDGLQIAVQMGVRNVHASVDSKLVANQVLETYVAKNMVKYLEKAKSLISGFANFP